MIRYLKRYKMLSLFFLSTLIVFVSGILFHVFIGDEYKEIISKNIDLLINNQLIDFKNLITNNLFITVGIWALGISVVGIIFILPLYLFKVFIFSFESICLLTNLGIKNILVILLYLLPNFINLVVYFIICYYAVTYSLYLVRHLFRNVNYNMYFITRKYLLILVISVVLIIISSVLEMFILPNLNIIKL